MTPLRVVIADDEPAARSALRRSLSQIEGVELIGEVSNGLELVSLSLAARPDVAFVDIQMPGLDGLEAASTLRGQGVPFVVFVTAHSEHAVAAFEREALDYIVKPVRAERVAASIARIRALGALRLNETQFEAGSASLLPQADLRCIVRVGGALRPVDLNDIELAEAAGNYVRAHFDETTHLLRTSLTELVRQCAGQLIRVHRSFALRGKDVVELSRSDGADLVAVLRSGRAVPVGRTYWGDLRTRLGG